jgi:uncharacterized protein (TIGR02594 family)
MLEVRYSTELFKAPAADAEILKAISVSARIELEEIARPTTEWVEVKARYPRPLQGFVRAADVVEVDAKSVLPVDLWSFIEYCSIASADHNEKKASSAVGVSRDYLLALALVLNGAESTDITAGFPNGFDPYRFKKEEWEEFCASGSNTNHHQIFDRRDPLAQIDGAVYVTAEWIGEIVLARTDMSTDGGPYIPNSIELFLAHMLGKAGVAALSDPSKSWQGYVSTAGGNVATAETRYPQFLQGAPSVAAVFDRIETAFDRAYANVATVVEDGFDAPPPAGEPSWLATARAEEQKHIREPNVRITEYFAATDYGSPTPTTAWCGAFVAFCLDKNSSKPPKGAARAANWAAWGKELPIGAEPPLGAVVVLAPEPGTDSSGHVAFYAGRDTNKEKLLLLGGNQSNALNITPFERKNIVTIRWPAEGIMTGRQPPADTGDIDIDFFSEENWKKYCHKLGELESGNDYTKVNRLGYCGRWQFGALVLIDLRYLHRGCKQRQVADDGFWTGKDGMSSRRHWLASPSVQDAAMRDLTRINFDRLVKRKVLSKADTPERIAGILAAAHLVGCGGAEDYVRGKIRRDANNVTSATYYAKVAAVFA